MPVAIKHFTPDWTAKNLKVREWYHNDGFQMGRFEDGELVELSPSQCPSYHLWSAPHPKEVRDKFR